MEHFTIHKIRPGFARRGAVSLGWTRCGKDSYGVMVKQRRYRTKRGCACLDKPCCGWHWSITNELEQGEALQKSKLLVFARQGKTRQDAMGLDAEWTPMG